LAKYKYEKCASNIALSYGIVVDKKSFHCFTSVFVLNAKLCSIHALILEVFGGVNLVSLSGYFGFFLKKYGLIFKSTVATLH